MSTISALLLARPELFVVIQKVAESHGFSYCAIMAVELPRNIILLDMVEKGEKGGGMFSYGLMDYDDILMHTWHATLFGVPHSPFENRIYQLKIYFGDNFPKQEQPQVNFITKINLKYVDEGGRVDVTSLLKSDSSKNPINIIEKMLIILREEMKNTRIAQPKENSCYEKSKPYQ